MQAIIILMKYAYVSILLFIFLGHMGYTNLLQMVLLVDEIE